jgi:hypothetical protein
MPLSIKFPDVRDIPAEATLLATPPPVWKPKAVAELARKAHVKGDVVDHGLWLVVRDAHASLEVYQATHSLRYSVLNPKGEPQPAGHIDAKKARAVADKWVQQFGPAGAQVELHSIAEAELLVSHRAGAKPKRFVTAVQVNYRFLVGDLPLLGSGGKMQVGVDAAGKVTDAYRFWREPHPMSTVRLTPPEQAFEQFSRSDLFRDLSDDSGARAEVTEVTVGYFALPPTEAQMVLVPVYEFRGVLATEMHPHYEFISHLPAAAIDGSAVKRAGRPVRSPDAVSG